MSKGYKPEPLLRSQVGQKKCIKQPGGTSLCIEGRKFGFSGELIGISGKKPGLPVPTSNPSTGEPARTMNQAVENATKFLKRVHGKNN